METGPISSPLLEDGAAAPSSETLSNSRQECCRFLHPWLGGRRSRAERLLLALIVIGTLGGIIEFTWPLDSGTAASETARQPSLLLTLSIAGVVLAGLALVYLRWKRVAASLRESESRARAILDVALDCIITADHEGKILEFNQAAEKTFGHRRQDVIGRRLNELIVPPANREAHERGLRHYLATGEGRILGRRIEVTALRADGTEFPIELTADVIRQAGPPMFTAYLRDLTEVKQYEAALNERVRLATLAANMGAILTHGVNLQSTLQACAELLVKSLDAAFVRIWTLNEADHVLVLEASAGLYTHLDGPHSRVPVGQLKIGQIAATRQPHLTNEVIGDPRVGDQQWARREGMVAFAGYPLICQGQLVGVVAMFSRKKLSQVTIKAIEAVADGIAMGIKRCHVADELHASREQFELAVRGSTDGLWDWNLLTDDCYLSPRVKEMLGFEEHELENHFSAISARFHPDDRDIIMARLRQAIDGHTLFVSEHRQLTKSGEYRWYFVRGQLLWHDHGQAYRMAGSVTDVTERKQMEATLAERDKQLRQSQKLEAIGLLAGGISHEFNNLLQAILGYTKLAIESLPNDAQPRRDLEQVKKAAERASTLTRQLLGFSRKQVFRPVPLDPRVVVRDLIKMLRPLIGEQIEVVKLPTDDAGTLSADPGQLQQMLLNLCINSRDAMPTGGRLVLKTERVELGEAYCKLYSLARPGAYVLFSVADTGCGMSAQVKDRLFEPFFTTKEVGRGTGLGLAMVYGVVEQHGGMINVYSEVGVGTTFKIYLPLTGVVPARLAQAAPIPVQGGGETILLAEDDAMVRELAARILKRAGYSLLIAADGREAIELFEANADRISLALLDAVMPMFTGREVHDRIRARKPGLPVVFCSGYDPDTGPLTFLKERGLRVVSKPFDPETLLSTLREVLDSRPALVNVASLPELPVSSPVAESTPSVV
jgi:PAS domain S-box-containing protein